MKNILTLVAFAVTLTVQATYAQGEFYPILHFEGGHWGTEGGEDSDRDDGGHWGTEGGHWGTRETEKEALMYELLTKNPEHISAIYKVKGQSNQGQPYSVYKSSYPARLKAQPNPFDGLFANAKVNLFSHILICYDQELRVEVDTLRQPLQEFSDRLNGNAKKLSIEQKVVNLQQDNLQDCSVVFKRGSWSTYPYVRLPRLKEDQTADRLAQNFYAVYFQLEDDTIPVVSFNPDIALNFDMNDPQYFKIIDEHIVEVHAPTLILHEIGHLLGFEHIPVNNSYAKLPEITVMGLHSPTSNLLRQADFSRRIQLRYADGQYFSPVWDLRQTSIYRSALWNDPFSSHSICLNRDEKLSLIVGLVKKDEVSGLAEGEWPLQKIDTPNVFVQLKRFYGPHMSFFKIGENAYIFWGRSVEEDFFNFQKLRIKSAGDSWYLLADVQVAATKREDAYRFRSSLGIFVHEAGGVQSLKPATNVLPIVYAPTPDKCQVAGL